MAKLFGTDGVRGLANRDVTPELAVSLAVSAAHVMSQRPEYEKETPRAIVGTDSRISGDVLAAAVAAGLASAGLEVLYLGTLPTPGLAYLTAVMDVEVGVMLSASHNPAADNGIKFFAHGGYKLPDEVEEQIEARLNEPWDRPTGAGIGRIHSDPVAKLTYVDHLVSTSPCKLTGLKMVLDCAHGASAEVAPDVMRRLGADVHVIAGGPDGININDGVGSTHPERLQRTVVERGADVGFAFDGDADRCLAVDSEGKLVNGDQLMGLLAINLAQQDELPAKTLVATVMSNIGLERAMAEHEINVVRTGVGDRYVLEEMRRNGYGLGGEQSGHVIMSKYATTGDGILTAVQAAASMVQSTRSIAELAAQIPQFPQALINVPEVDKVRANDDERVLAAVANAERRLGDSGRVLLRPSGTEPLVRVMVEAGTQVEADEVCSSLAEVVREALAL